MSVLQGNTTGSIASVALNIPCTIVSFSLVNMTGGSITVGVVIVPAGEDAPVYIWNGVIAQDTSYVSDVPVIVLSGYQILITSSGSVDYYFSLSE
jgi:hypothetical protein